MNDACKVCRLSKAALFFLWWDGVRVLLAVFCLILRAKLTDICMHLADSILSDSLEALNSISHKKHAPLSNIATHKISAITKFCELTQKEVLLHRVLGPFSTWLTFSLFRAEMLPLTPSF